MQVWVEVSIAGRIAVSARDLAAADRRAQEVLHPVHRRKPAGRVGDLELRVDEALPASPGALPSEVAPGHWELPVAVFASAVVDAPTPVVGAGRVRAALAGLPGGALVLGDTGVSVAVDAVSVVAMRGY